LLLAEYKKARQELKKLFEKTFVEGSKELFEKYPKMDSFGWPQYAPHFNDGDPCIFSVRAYEETIHINGDRFYDEDYDEEVDQSDGCLAAEAEEKVRWAEEATDEICTFINMFDDDDLAEFGEGLITVYRNGKIEEDYYDHD
jgi:hypothetical protein